ncbi:MAG: peptidylprolyl isomerase [Rhodospirillales bacterium]|nr:peptidylprolyl isomerase [Rhodospirillales bacterium]
MRFSTVFAAMLALTLATPALTQSPDPENVLVLELEDGTVLIEMLPQRAPNHVQRIKQLTREGFYDGLKWHRVIDGFMAQTGDPQGTGLGGSNLPDLIDEFNLEVFTEGAVGMAKTPAPDSANSQWFICTTDCQHLNGQYTLWGRVIDGMSAVKRIEKGSGPSGMVNSPDHILSMKVQADTQ